MKLSEVAQAMKEQIPREPEIPKPAKEQEPMEATLKLKQTLVNLQQQAPSIAVNLGKTAPPSPPPPPTEEAIDIMSDTEPVEVPSGGEEPWQHVRRRSRSRQEQHQEGPNNAGRKKKVKNPNTAKPKK